ncbi:uncharacterized protein TRIADDRAFT_52191 [Trichoplax adhaerens]|uniref:X-ray radiation resistance-associated protein 1 n=1 Tax=Trichoplax adhaerens TaxID=10228 RepID=B3RM08_TRIAD|nr:hypothetical protein TRIADDRAFT_52191 [Trichoplax adhaerens]EDV29616.1 hypothetical protein TRIADDRAFT_52191 [Trichoplax adhaerens]|eukprot:XP_002108818.1 hypothetical protein TRIADDRAFT_52191 [Trichoplax adhaerens]
MANINDIPISNITNAFPIRHYRKLGSKTGSGGAWLIAYNIAQQNHFKAILCAEKGEKKEEGRTLSNNRGEIIKNPKNTPAVKNSPLKVLDGFFLLKHCGVEDPSDLCSINISGCQLTDVNSEDLALFDNVVHINAGENELPIEKLKTFPELRELEMQLNDLSDISINTGEFTKLHALDLSYNCLNKNDILNLGTLPQLRLLKLTGNDLGSLPLELSATSTPSHSDNVKEKEKHKPLYPSLEYLYLDSNQLTETCFLPIAGLKNLRYLNLDNNEITCVPSISLLLKMRISSGTTNPSKRRSVAPISAGSERSNIISEGRKIDDDEIKSVQSRADSNVTFEHTELPRHPTVESILGSSIISSSLSDDETAFPFYYLQALSVANNSIATEEALLSLAEYPQVKELVIYGNPLLTKIKGNPPLLTKELVKARGIHVVRTNVDDEWKSKKYRPRPIVNQRRKVQDVLPPIPKRRYPLSIEAPYYNFSQPLPTTQDTISSDHPSSNTEIIDDIPNEILQEKMNEVEDNDDENNFFLTQQQNDFDRPLTSSLEKSTAEDQYIKEEIIPHEKQREVAKKLPKKYKGFEELASGLDDDKPENNFPKDMQSSVRALKYALHHPLTYQEEEPVNYYKPKLRLGYNTSRSKTTNDKLQSALTVIQGDLNTMEGNLDNLLRKSDQDKDDAVRLLSRVQTKYEEFREATLKSVASTCEALHEGLDSVLGTEVTNISPAASPEMSIKASQQQLLKSSPSSANSNNDSRTLHSPF